MILGFWLSVCIILDLVIMLSMYVFGMMNILDFIVVGLVMFFVFNWVELFCSILGLIGLLVLSVILNYFVKNNKIVIIFFIVLLVIVLIDIYGLIF